MKSIDANSAFLEDDAQLQCAKQRLYVFCQTGGWLFFLAVQTLFTALFSEKALNLQHWSVIVQVCLEGLLITHYSRRIIAKLGWKQLGWKGLTPRILLMAILQSITWTVVGYGVTYLLLRLPWESKVSPGLSIGISIFDGTLVMVGWLCLYFFYDLFDRYNRLQIERLRLATTVKEAELRALKAQINPHFMFRFRWSANWRWFRII